MDKPCKEKRNISSPEHVFKNTKLLTPKNSGRTFHGPNQKSIQVSSPPCHVPATCLGVQLGAASLLAAWAALSPGSRRVNKQNVYIEAPCPDPAWRCRTTSLPSASWPSPVGITPWGGRKAFCLWDVSGRRDTGRGQQALAKVLCWVLSSILWLWSCETHTCSSSSPCTCCFLQSAN